MADKTRISWCDSTWSPFRGCSRIASGCVNCYAERMAARGLPGLMASDGKPFAFMTMSGPHWTGRVELIESQMDWPLRRRKPRVIFVNSMSDTFHEAVPDEWIDRVFAVMARCWQHTFIVPTKRIKRARKYFTNGPARVDGICAALLDHRLFPGDPRRALLSGPRGGPSRAGLAEGFRSGWRSTALPNVILLASVSNQADADRDIPELLATPAAVRGISLEPMIGPVDLRRIEIKTPGSGGPVFLDALTGNACSVGGNWQHGKLDWCIVGGESGPGARPCDVEWIRSVVRQCAEAGVPCWVKQLGAHWSKQGQALDLKPRGKYSVAGADPAEWPEDVRVQQRPERSEG